PSPKYQIVLNSRGGNGMRTPVRSRYWSEAWQRRPNLEGVPMAVETQAPPTLGTIVHVEIGAKEAQKLVDFYGGVFGWKFAGAPGMEDYKMAETPGDSDVAIYTSEEPRLTNYVSVDDVKTYVEKITAHGGTVIHE